MIVSLSWSGWLASAAGLPWQARRRNSPSQLSRLRFTSGATRRRRRLWRGKQVTVAPGIERDELGSEEETDYATTE